MIRQPFLGACRMNIWGRISAENPRYSGVLAGDKAVSFQGQDGIFADGLVLAFIIFKSS